ncbi:Sugar transporter erd6-like [Thalictrum thalictroides]|uniref:Sugar transporter erd6-like n=1 Tax=Thalictrum thalictroides TaxID=46969 RepID=A0A7J6V825_THATH|nr:Sugar transporter erd6-like [Thalictrum thalictroides]
MLSAYNLAPRNASAAFQKLTIAKKLVLKFHTLVLKEPCFVVVDLTCRCHRWQLTTNNADTRTITHPPSILHRKDTRSTAQMANNEDIEIGGSTGLDAVKEPFISKQDNSANDFNGSSDEGSLRMVLLSTFVAVCGSFEFGSCVGYSAPTQSAIREDLNQSLAQGSLLLDSGRFLTGYGIGIFSYVIPVFIAEIAPKNIRGGLATVNQLMIVSGSSVAFLIGSLVTWRTLALTGIIPCLVLLVGLFFVPESPRWLVKVGHQKEFEAALQRLRGKDADVSLEAIEIKDYIEALNYLPKARMIDLFQSKYIRPVIIGIGLMVFQQFGGINGIGFYASETFELAGFSSGKIGTVAYASIQVPITILGAFLMDKSGRRVLLMVSASGTFLGCLMAGVSFYLKVHGMFLEWAPLIAIFGVLIYIGFFSIGMGPVPWVIMSEIFPINVKGVAGSLVTLVNWFGAWAVSYTFNFLMSWSSSGTFFLYSGVCAITVLFVAKLVPETKGKTLEEIQASINTDDKSMQLF